MRYLKKTKRTPSLRGLTVLVGLLLVATACQTEIEGSDGTVTPIDATAQIRYAETPDRAESLDLDDAAVKGPIHVFLAYLGSNIERVQWTVDGKTANRDADPPFDLVGGDSTRAMPLDTEELLDGNHTVTAQVATEEGVTLEVDATFTVVDGAAADGTSSAEGRPELLSANQRSMEEGTGGWRDQGNSVIAAGTEAAKDGRQSLLTTVSKDGTWTDDAGTSRIGTDPIPAKPNEGYEGQAFVQVDDEDSRPRCEIRFYDGSKILDTTPGPFAAAKPGGWSPVSCTAQSPSGTTHVGFRILVENADWGERFMVDDAHLWGTEGDAAEAPAEAPKESSTPLPAPLTPEPAPEVAAAPAPAPEPAPAPAPQPAPAPSSGRFPDSSSTGPSGNLAPSGSVRVTQNGATVENLKVTGNITVDADNVTIRNVHIIATAHYGINVSGKNVTIEDVEIDGRSGCGVGLAPYGEWTARRIDVHGCSDGIGMKSNQTLVDSYCHDLMVTRISHNDCIQTVGGSNSVIRGNSLHAPYHQTAAIIMSTNRAPTTNWLIENNQFAGGGYSINIGPNKFGTPSNLTFRNNVFVRGTQQFGPKVIQAKNLTWTGNTWDDGTPLN